MMIRKTLLLAVFVLFPFAHAQAVELKTHTGDPKPPPLTLRDLSGKTHRLADYRGQVVLVNFWATWCPPCVHEMPSMQRLQENMRGRKFVILAVNMGESEEDVRAFMKKIGVNFPVLMDKDGEALRAWKVFAFPTSFVIGPSGDIRYSLFGAIDWDSPEVIEKIQALLRR